MQLSRPPRRVGAVIAALLLTSGTAIAAAPTAQADLLPHVVCASGVLELTFTPGLTLEEQPVRFSGSGSLGGCVDTANPLVVFGGDVTVTNGSGNNSCLFSEDVNADVAITWNGGAGPSNSKLVLDGIEVQVGNQVLFTGTVTGGRYRDDMLTVEWVGPTVGPGETCLDEAGVRHISGAAVGAFTTP
ncbi:hypothetical protein [Saccharothrix obliqua]|uniref:hypothetical protein n=1 Tax=Saccharothrix obliqua TaxID=2861747 RepID=UPI001C5E294F|nr:hypothetical protein [Saccharothrix obliqua]MBW4718635.1 hypothetical protein [Saccharothrix obliqua]